MWDDLGRALALVLVIEGMWPFLAPARWRALLLRVASLEDKQLRTIGFASMAAGLVLLQVLQLA
jgi:uncharacterized protein YjeT (DUF2065 family)